MKSPFSRNPMVFPVKSAQVLPVPDPSSPDLPSLPRGFAHGAVDALAGPGTPPGLEALDLALQIGTLGGFLWS